MKKKIIAGVVVAAVLLTGIIFWWQGRDVSTTEGEIVETFGDSILLLTKEGAEYDSQTAAGDLSFAWENADDFQAGDQVKIWIKGPIAMSYPAQATVTKVEKIN